MAVTYGFYNSVNKDRSYNAIQFSQIFDGVINDGIYMSVGNHFLVRPGSGMNVVVGSGRAWFNHTWTYNDSDLIVPIDQSEFEANRIDAVVIKIDHRDVGRANSIEVIKGTPASSPVKPVFPDGDDIYYHPLAYVTVGRGVTSITDADVETAIGIDPRSLFVTGIIETISAAELYNQWGAEWDQWNQEHRDAFETWTAQQETDMINWENAQKEAFLEWMADEKADYEEWEANSKAEFDEWFANIQYILDGDVAGHLQNEIDTIRSEDIFEAYADMTNSTSTFERNSNGNISRITTVDDDRDITYVKEYVNNLNDIRINETITKGMYVYTRTTTFDGTECIQTYSKEEAE